ATADQLRVGMTLMPVALLAGATKLGAPAAAAETPSSSAEVWFRMPLTPSAVKAYSPESNAAPPFRVSRVDPAPTTGLGAKLAVVEPGNPEAEKVTGALNPLSTPTRRSQVGSPDVVEHTSTRAGVSLTRAKSGSPQPGKVNEHTRVRQL